MRFPTYGKRRDSKKADVRRPFAKAVVQGRVPGWKGACVVRSFLGGAKRTPRPDLALVLPAKLGIVVCSVSGSAGLRRGSVEQVLSSIGQFRSLPRGERVRCLVEAKPVGSRERLEEEAAKSLAIAADDPAAVVPIIVVDRWGKAMNATVGYALSVIDAALGSLGHAQVEVYAVGSGKPEPVLPWWRGTARRKAA
ncbi:MAG TPA: hypothetical protein VGK67_11555 [Myxococcales bacterium]